MSSNNEEECLAKPIRVNSIFKISTDKGSHAIEGNKLSRDAYMQ
ncbi:hypothetical protein [Acinetobacter sp. NIPH 2699]|nr:hypothetical protein [Acinetobacter sp. NIPH 2699]